MFNLEANIPAHIFALDAPLSYGITTGQEGPISAKVTRIAIRDGKPVLVPITPAELQKFDSLRSQRVTGNPRSVEAIPEDLTASLSRYPKNGLLRVGGTLETVLYETSRYNQGCNVYRYTDHILHYGGLPDFTITFWGRLEAFEPGPLPESIYISVFSDCFIFWIEAKAGNTPGERYQVSVTDMHVGWQSDTRVGVPDPFPPTWQVMYRSLAPLIANSPGR